ncbi:MAG TPA: hypothetical protein VGV85_00025 [Longimicrobiaceae bacterium]|nr:hypothetical protein [Longimicrobiaceae bacterium]
MKPAGRLSRHKELERSPWNVDGVPGKHARKRIATKTAPRRTGRVTSDKPETAARRRARQQKRAVRTYGDHAAWIRDQLCALSWVGGRGRNRIVASHAWHTRGSVGTAKDLLPLLLSLEEEIHATGRETFAAEHMVDLNAAAAWYAAHSPVLNPALAVELRTLPCAGPCYNRGPHVALVMPDGSHLGWCGDRDCRWEIEEHVQREFIAAGKLPPFFAPIPEGAW